MKLYVKGARLAYDRSLFTATAKDGDPTAVPSYKSTFIIEPTTLGFVGDANPEHPTGIDNGYKYGPFKEALSGGITKVATEKFVDQAKAILLQLKAQNRIILHDGAEKGDKAGYPGNHYFNAGNKIRPTLLSKSGVEVTQADSPFYPGCYVDAVCELWAGPNHKKAPMVGVTLLGVRFNRDGERLGGGVTASEDDFAPVAEAAQQAAADTGKGAASLF